MWVTKNINLLSWLQDDTTRCMYRVYTAYNLSVKKQMIFFFCLTFTISSGVPPSTSMPPFNLNPHGEYSPSLWISSDRMYSRWLQYIVDMNHICTFLLFFYMLFCHLSICFNLFTSLQLTVLPDKKKSQKLWV